MFVLFCVLQFKNSSLDGDSVKAIAQEESVAVVDRENGMKVRTFCLNAKDANQLTTSPHNLTPDFALFISGPFHCPANPRMPLTC